MTCASGSSSSAIRAGTLVTLAPRILLGIARQPT
jgi:hypothetical protein